MYLMFLSKLLAKCGQAFRLLQSNTATATAIASQLIKPCYYFIGIDFTQS